MAGLKALAKETAIYGLSSILGRFLNWCLVPLYTWIFADQEYGIVSYLYSFTAVALVILTYGMETGFFRYANKSERPETVYTTSLISVGATSLIFIFLLSLFIHPISNAIKLPQHADYVWMLGAIVAVDAFTNIPFAYLRYKKRAIRFASIKMLNVIVNIGANVFFLLCCPWIAKHAPATINWFYEPLGGEAYGIGWIFIANVLSTVVVTLTLLPEIIGRKYIMDGALLRKMLSYSWPLLILGVAGIMSQNMGQMIIPYLFADLSVARAMVGIYGANIKIAIIMVMFTQAFRYAFEPFIFSQAGSKGNDKGQAYCDAMKFFIILGLFIFLGVMFYLPILKHFVGPSYWPGLDVVPIMMIAELFMGIAFNLSLWYKLTDRTAWGMYLSVGCFIVMLGLNLLLVPMIGAPRGYMGSAWAALIAYGLMMFVSWLAGQHYYPLKYDYKRIGLYTAMAAALYLTGKYALNFPNYMWATYLTRTVLLVVYLLLIVKYEHLPLPGRRR
ncbi:MAG: polysaccharide biosynthesis C-terminal domain-containing protein [Muribaculaceae bacterium]|nr:polysaccharide biosynthesis C-terminal domain-containing protein [Muribaculaceae bacterium]